MHYFATTDNSALPPSTPKITKALKKKMFCVSQAKGQGLSVTYEKIVNTP